jgi:hypothetical protein
MDTIHGVGKQRDQVGNRESVPDLSAPRTSVIPATRGGTIRRDCGVSSGAR